MTAGAAIVLSGVAAWSLGATHQQREVVMPREVAAPGDVVSTYLDALDARDCGTARRLLAGDSTLGATWCADVDSLDLVSVGPVRTRPDGDVVVPVTFDVTWRWLHDDASLPPGRTRWTYRLERFSPTSPWRIVDQGAARGASA